jgi:hypothetical protein
LKCARAGMEPCNAVAAGRPRLPVKVHATAGIAGRPRDGEVREEGHNPTTGRVVATPAAANPRQLAAACRGGSISRLKLTCDDRRGTLMRTAAKLGWRRERIACLTTGKCGVCLEDARDEVDRACDVRPGRPDGDPGRQRSQLLRRHPARQGQNGLFSGSACAVVHRGEVICVRNG